MKKIHTHKIIFVIMLLASQNLLFAQDSEEFSLIANQTRNFNNIKSIDAKCSAGKVFLHIRTIGITENKTLAVERSLDGINFELIGTIHCIGCAAMVEIAYYFTDEAPLDSKIYYRLVNYTENNQASYSDCISVFQENQTNTTSNNATISEFTKK
jgi:hypothetical protein